jgi:hypothetical protein
MIFSHSITKTKQTYTKPYLEWISKLQPIIKFITEKELKGSINFVDLTINCEDKKLKF